METMLTAHDPERDPCAPGSSATAGTRDASTIRNTTPSPRLPAPPPSLSNPQPYGRTYCGNPCAPGSCATVGTRTPIPVHSSDMDKRAPPHRTSPITTPAKVTRSPMRSTAPRPSLAMTRTTSKRNSLRSKTHRRGLKEPKRQSPTSLTFITSPAPTSPAPRPARAQPGLSSTSGALAPVRPMLPTPLPTPPAGNDLRRSILPPPGRHSLPRPAPTDSAPGQRSPTPPPPPRPPTKTAPDGSPKLSRAQSRKRRRILGQLTFVLLPACPTASAPPPTSAGHI